jgi:hypothetical protein
MVRPIKYAPIRPSLEEVAVHAGHEVLMEVNDNISLITGDPQGILDQHLWPNLINLFIICCELNIKV